MSSSVFELSDSKFADRADPFGTHSFPNPLVRTMDCEGIISVRVITHDYRFPDNNGYRWVFYADGAEAIEKLAPFREQIMYEIRESNRFVRENPSGSILVDDPRDMLQEVLYLCSDSVIGVSKVMEIEYPKSHRNGILFIERDGDSEINNAAEPILLTIGACISPRLDNPNPFLAELEKVAILKNMELEKAIPEQSVAYA